ncbi:uncharacterized protein FIBRA_08107 [Fibroporia radiculosa]|uniref:Uncharacterized protein n=1 Tax=Fibroporia radiculosa TaxID=599839 RepID=J4GW78_9APHY|nr:uncharacterized protein FIBRA_08107 [Fibroporia radiculosa]CCM05870.1 predicted protein [Fibroporia radiculosa]
MARSVLRPGMGRGGVVVVVVVGREVVVEEEGADDGDDDGEEGGKIVRELQGSGLISLVVAIHSRMARFPTVLSAHLSLYTLPEILMPALPPPHFRRTPVRLTTELLLFGAAVLSLRLKRPRMTSVTSTTPAPWRTLETKRGIGAACLNESQTPYAPALITLDV